MIEETFIPDGALVPWPIGPEVECCANCAYGNTDENECMNVYHP